MREKATLTRDVTLAALGGEISDRTARTYYQGNREVRADVQSGQKIGDNVVVFNKGDVPDGACREEEEALLREEAELTDRLKALRERRGG